MLTPSAPSAFCPMSFDWPLELYWLLLKLYLLLWLSPKAAQFSAGFFTGCHPKCSWSSLSTMPLTQLGMAFTAKQRAELEHQVQLTKYLVANVPVPPELLLPLGTTGLQFDGLSTQSSFFPSLSREWSAIDHLKGCSLSNSGAFTVWPLYWEHVWAPAFQTRNLFANLYRLLVLLRLLFPLDAQF